MFKNKEMWNEGIGNIKDTHNTYTYINNIF